jgi:hypothetical protein
MNTVNKYRTYCNDESNYVYSWGTAAPTTCVNNSAHAIDTSTITIVDQVKKNDVNIANLYVDAFGRLKVTDTTTIFTLHHALGQKTLYMDMKTVGTGESYLDTDISSFVLKVNDVGDRVVYQTRQYYSYVPGHSRIVYMTGVLQVTTDPGVRSRFGTYDNAYDKIGDVSTAQDGSVGTQTIWGNGHFIEFYNNILYFVERTSTRGTEQSDYRIPQSGWNLDTLDGNGPSGITIDPSKALLLIIETSWLGVNIVKMGFKVGVSLVWCHVWEHNNLQVPYIRYAKLPIRYEIENVSAADTSCSMRSMCASVQIEGDQDDNNSVRGINLSYCDDSERFVLKGDWFPIFSIRLSSASLRRTIAITSLNINTGTRGIKWRLVLNPVLIDPNWTTFLSHPDSQAEFDVSTEICGKVDGSLVGFPFESGTVGPDFTMYYDISSSSDITLNADIAGNSDIICLQACGISNTAKFSYTINWQEQF